MRYLSWDDVRGLEKFLAEDNDDAIGIEIHTGLYDSSAEDPYGKPETVKTYTLEELAGGDFIQVGTLTVRAVVGNRLYYTDSRNWVDHSGTDVPDIGGRRGDGYEYERAVLTFKDPIVTVPDREILALKKFVARDNKRVKAIMLRPGCMGIGGSNTSDFSADYDETVTYPVEILDGRGFIWVKGVALCALIHDVLYCRYTGRNGEKRVYTLNYRERDYIVHGESIGYDTISATEIVLMLE